MYTNSSVNEKRQGNLVTDVRGWCTVSSKLKKLMEKRFLKSVNIKMQWNICGQGYTTPSQVLGEGLSHYVPDFISPTLNTIEYYV